MVYGWICPQTPQAPLTEACVKPREDMRTQATVADLTFFVDGFCFRDSIGSHAGYTVLQLRPGGTFMAVQAAKLPQPCSTQLAQIEALTAACQLAAGNIYTDSTYACGVCHVNGKIWQQHGFRWADRTSLTHGEAISALLDTIYLPSALTIIKYSAHQKTETMIDKGNNLADEAARSVASAASTCCIWGRLWTPYHLVFPNWCSTSGWHLWAERVD